MDNTLNDVYDTSASWWYFSGKYSYCTPEPDRYHEYDILTSASQNFSLLAII